MPSRHPAWRIPLSRTKATEPVTRQWRKRLATYRDRAVVLRKLDYGEADRIFTLLTRNHGKGGAIAKGGRRPGPKLGPSRGVSRPRDGLLPQGPGALCRQRHGAT